jgi:adenylylsulfate kinase
MYKETNTRSIVKTISWRILATLTTMSLVYIFIGDMTIAISVGGIEVFLKMLIYFLHERAWDKIKFGKKEIKPAVIWITGLAKSGKKDIAKELVELIRSKGFKVEYLDGHTIRELLPEIGHSRDEVNIHIKRVGVLAKKLEEQGVFVVASFLSPFRESREFVKDLCNNFYEVHVNTPLEICTQRDETGIYQKAKEGIVNNFPGLDVEYEEPLNGAMRFDISKIEAKEAAKQIYNEVSKTM